MLLFLQKKGGKFGSGSKTGKGVQFLIACNKNDLFTALPAGRIKGLLEREITKIRESRAKGLMSSGVKGADEMGGDEESEWLGEGGEGEFKLEMMEEVGVHVSVRGGSVEKDQSEVWWQWIGDCL